MAYSYKRSITIDYTKCGSANSTDFPILVSGTYSYLATVANGGLVQNSNGYDIAFYSDLALTTPLYWEIERYIATTGEVVFWVKIPTVSYTVDTVIYMAYGDSGIATFQSTSTSVWNSNYKGVWHLPDGTTLGALDSTSIGSNGTITSATAVAGKIDGGATFNGTTAKIDVGDMPSIEAQSKLTMTCWINPTALADYKGLIVKGSSGTSQVALALGGSGIGSNSALLATMRNGVDSYGHTASSVVSTGNWYLVKYVFDGTLSGNSNRLKVYVNGVQKSLTFNGTIGATTPSNAVNMFFADNNTYFFNGLMDEIRASIDADSQDWATTEYNNQNSPSTFYSIGTQISSGQSNFFRMF